MPASSGGTATLGFMDLTIGGSVIVGKGSTLDVSLRGGHVQPREPLVDNGGTLAFDLGEHRQARLLA